MVWCEYCRKEVPGIRPYDGALACNICGRILENFNYSTEVVFTKNAAGQSQAAGNIVRSVENEISSSRQRRYRIARDELMSLKDALRIGDMREDVIDMAAKFFEFAVEQFFTKGRRSELVQASCLYLACREKEIPILLIHFSSYLRVSVYELGSVYLQLCERLYLVEKQNYEKLVDPSIFIEGFSNKLLKGKHEDVVRTATYIIASMKRDWIQTGRKPSGVCGAALYTAALSHGIKCSKSDIVNIVHICEATLTKRLIEFGNTESGSLNVDELTEREIEKRTFTMEPTSNKEAVLCMHQDCTPFGYGLCKACYEDFVKISGGLVGGSDPPAFQRAEQERIEKVAREENEEGNGSLNHDEPLCQSERGPDYCSVNKSHKLCREKSEENKDGAEEYADTSDESDNFSDIDDDEVDFYINNEEERRYKKIVWEEMNKEYLEEQAKDAALKAASEAGNSNCPEHVRELYRATKAAKTQLRKEKQQKKAEERKNLAPPETTAEAVRRELGKKRHTGINDDLLDELFNISPCEKSPKRSKTETDIQKKEEKNNEHENGNNEDEAGENEEGDIVHRFSNGENFYEEEKEDDGYDFE